MTKNKGSESVHNGPMLGRMFCAGWSAAELDT